MRTTKERWIGFSLFNLCIVAILGFALRSKILFPLPFIDFRNLESAHSHFAFSGWVGLSLTTCLIYELFPREVYGKKIYQWILWLSMITAWGMLITFPFTGYAAGSIIFSTGYIFTNYVFAVTFIKDVKKHVGDKGIRWLCYSAVASLVLSSIGPFGLAYQMISKSRGLFSFRDFIYTFLHFQYNGFFTLGVLALFLNRLLKVTKPLPKAAWPFCVFVCCSILPSLFLSLLWHNQPVLYLVAGLGALLLAASLYYLVRISAGLRHGELFSGQPARLLFKLSFFSLGLKLLLQIGTIFPVLGNAVYGDRPLIIGFLHLVFLGYVTLYLLSSFINEGYFMIKERIIIVPFIVFTVGVFINEVLLMLQGLGILLQTNSKIFDWLLWITSAILFTGAIMIRAAFRSSEK